MVRVLQVVTYMGRGGLETMLMNYYRNIDRNLVQFDFLVHRDFQADYDNEIESLGGRIYRLPVLNPFNIRYRTELNYFFKSHPEYSVVHVHQDCMSSIILKAAAKYNVPIRIAHSHNSRQERNLKLLVKLFYKHLIPKYATELMACGVEAGKWMYGHHNFDVLRNAIHASEYLPDEHIRSEKRDQYGVKQELLIGHVGRFSYQKNHLFLIDVFDQIQKTVPAKLILIGGESLRLEDKDLPKQIHSKVKSYGIEDKVIFAGVCDNIPELMQAMDVFVFPSHYEGLPVTIVEAQAAGLPCIISDAISSESILTDRVKTVSLSESVEKWADITIQEAKKGKINTITQLQQSGFDIKENAARLQDYYIRVVSGEKEQCLF